MVNESVLEMANQFVQQLKRRDPRGRPNTYMVRALRKYIHIRVSGCLCFVVSPNGDIYEPRAGYGRSQAPMLTRYYGNVASMSKAAAWRRKGMGWNGYTLTVPWFNHRYKGRHRIANFNRSNPRGY